MKKYDRDEMVKKAFEVSQPEQLKKIGEAIRSRREELDVPVTALANMVSAIGGTSVRGNQIEDLEDGKTRYRVDMLLKVCAVLGLEITIKPIES